MNSLLAVISISVFWFSIGLLGAGLQRFHLVKMQLVFLLAALGSLVLLVISALSLTNPPLDLLLPLGLAGYGWQLHLDSLSAFFLLLLSAASLAINLFASDYFADFPDKAKAHLCWQYHLFLASMVWVFIAADAYSFMLAWEVMALSSYLLILGIKPDPATRQAAYIYLLIAHIGALAILLSFAVMLHDQNTFSFAAMQRANLSPLMADAAFALALFGFGAKAGLLPLHVWLPEAHPAAPSPISALLSGVMLKTAVYGLIRISLVLLGSSNTWWGVTTITLGVLTALFGVILAAMQTDMKRLLAYSSMENMGIIISAVGLALLFHHNHFDLFAALALGAALFHSFNHALFKSLLFLGTGSVLHATGERNLDKLGGLIKTMPWVAGFVLIGVLAIAGLPPFNGFISEWLLLQALVFFPKLPTQSLAMLLPLAAAAIVLTIGLAAYVMVKFYGIIFLGRPRGPNLAKTHDASLLQILSLAGLAIACVLFGIAPLLLWRPIATITSILTGSNPMALNVNSNAWFLIPINSARASYSPILFLLVIISIIVLIYGAVRFFYHGRFRRGPAWDCGYPLQSSRMQDSAEGFGQPIKFIFSSFLHLKMQLPDGFTPTPHFQIKAEDRFWYALYLPLVRTVSYCAAIVSKLQQGKISYYLLFSFTTLLFLWWLVA